MNFPLTTLLFETLDSTQTWAKSHVASFSKEKITCIVADEQTHGHGRYNRKWISPKGQNLYITFYFRLPSHTPNLSSLAQIACVSLAKVLLSEDLLPKIKWPNDLLLSEKKVSGVLCETSFQNEQVEIFLGIGLNVNTAQDLLNTIDQPATSLFEETKKSWDRMLLLKKLQKEFAADLSTFKKKGFSSFLPFLDHHLAYKGEKVILFDGNKKIEGILHSLREDGAINLYFPDSKKVESFFSGDLTLPNHHKKN